MSYAQSAHSCQDSDSDLAEESSITHWVRQAQAGNEYAFRVLFDRFHKKIMTMSMLSTKGDRELALEMVQDTFTRAFKYIHKIDQPARFAGWILSIATNVCRRNIQKEKKLKQLLDEIALDYDIFYCSKDNQEREEKIQMVTRIIDKIEDEGLRQIVLLKYSDPEHTSQEISNRLNIPIGTVTVKLMRFKASVRKKLLLDLMEHRGSLGEIS